MENISNPLLVKYDSVEISEKAPLKRQMRGDAGFDLYNSSNEILTVVPGESALIDAGIKIKLPDDYCALVYPRSSTFVKKNLLVIPGLLDAGYTGKVYTLVWHPNINDIDRPVLIEPWERLSQLIILPIPQINVISVDVLPTTERGYRGFGSTGN